MKRPCDFSSLRPRTIALNIKILRTFSLPPTDKINLLLTLPIPIITKRMSGGFVRDTGNGIVRIRNTMTSVMPAILEETLAVLSFILSLKTNKKISLIPEASNNLLTALSRGIAIR